MNVFILLMVSFLLSRTATCTPVLVPAVSEDDIQTGSESLNNDILLAAKNGDTARLLEAIQAGADVNAANSEGNTALHFATRFSHREVVRALLDMGADVNAQNIFGLPPVYNAACTGNTVIMKMLLEAGP
jgi:ankyrin repeat protein